MNILCCKKEKKNTKPLCTADIEKVPVFSLHSRIAWLNFVTEWNVQNGKKKKKKLCASILQGLILHYWNSSEIRKTKEKVAYSIQ